MEFTPKNLLQGTLIDRHVPDRRGVTKKKNSRALRKKLNKISKQSRKANR